MPHVGVRARRCAPSCSGVQWSSCWWVMTTATVPADSVIGRRELAGVDVELVAGVLDDERGVFELRESHASSQHRPSVGAQARRLPESLHDPSPRRLLVAVNPAASFGRNRAVGAAVAERLHRRGPRGVDAPRGELRARSGARPSRRSSRATDGLVVVGRRRHGRRSASTSSRRPGVPLGIVAAGTGNDLARGPRPAVRRSGGRRPTPSSAALAREPRAIDAGVIRHGGAAHVVRVRGLHGLRRGRERAREPDDPAARSEPVHARAGARAGHVPAAHVHDHDRRRPPRAAGDARLGGEQRVARRRHAHRAARRPRRRPARRVHRAPALARRPCSGCSPRCSRASTPTTPRSSSYGRAAFAIEADDIVAYADGERIGALPIDIEVVPGALSVFA